MKIFKSNALKLSGFTLVELMVTTVLLVLLAIAGLNAVATMHQIARRQATYHSVLFSGWRAGTFTRQGIHAAECAFSACPDRYVPHDIGFANCGWRGKYGGCDFDNGDYANLVRAQSNGDR